MKKIIVISIIGLVVWVLAGIEQDYKYGGLYNNYGFVSSVKSINFCAATKGEKEVSWLLKHANAAIEINLNDVKSLSLNEIKELRLKYPLRGKLNFTIGTDVASWKTLGFKPVEQPCIDSGDVLNFIYHVKSPYSKKSKHGLVSLKDDLTILSMNNNTLDDLQEYLQEYNDVPVYALLWESASGRTVDKGWVFKIHGKDKVKGTGVKTRSNVSKRIDLIFQLVRDIANDFGKFVMKAWDNPKKLVRDIANDLERFAK